MGRIFPDRFWWWVTGLAALSGLLYNSWPLGYVFNPAVARNGLASGLEALHQPYNWFFIAADIISSLLILLVCWLIWQRLKDSHPTKTIKLVILNVAVFATGTMADTLLPMHCEPSLQHCPSFTVDYFLLFHGIFSITAAVGLFISLALLWCQQRRNRVLAGLVFGYVLFGLTSLIEVVGLKGGNWSQHYYLTLCGVWLALIPYAIYTHTKPAKAKQYHGDGRPRRIERRKRL